MSYSWSMGRYRLRISESFRLRSSRTEIWVLLKDDSSFSKTFLPLISSLILSLPYLTSISRELIRSLIFWILWLIYCLRFSAYYFWCLSISLCISSERCSPFLSASLFISSIFLLRSLISNLNCLFLSRRSSANSAGSCNVESYLGDDEYGYWSVLIERVI